MSARLWQPIGEGRGGSCDAIGGKAASLDRIRRLGLPTPPGFCLTTSAQALYMSENNLLDAVERLRRRLPSEPVRAELERLMFAGPLPDELHEALDCGLRALAAKCGSVARLAARSSAILEDGATASFAGQHETLLDISPESMEGAVRRCWASLWSPRAMAYRQRRKLPFGPELMSVLVQPFVPADASAIVFTQSPVTGCRDEIVLAIARGLGKPLVSGSVNACTIVVDRPTLAILSANGSIPAGAANGVPEGVTVDGALTVSISSIEQLAELCLRVERDTGVPVDAEAALSGGDWWLLQARPITTATVVW